MAQNNYFDHNDVPIGRSWSTRISDCGYNHGTYIGENIAAGYPFAQSAFDAWKNSPGHNSNMLSTSFTAIGIGRYQGGGTFGTYWTTVFGGYDDGWMTISGGVAPIESPSVDGPGGGVAGGLDFSATCFVLRQRRHPLADLFCG
jgi:hypothetical protein